MELSRSQIVTGNTSHTRPENRAFYPALDGIRAVAFLLVFLQHYWAFPWGWTGVNIFFVLSGFLITGILYDSRDAPHRARHFYIRRTLRIFPLYYGIFILLLVLNPVMHWNWSIGWIAWPLYVGNFLRFLSPSSRIHGSRAQWVADAGLHSPRTAEGINFNFGHFWSLCVEEQFYLFWPWIVFWLRSRRVLIWVCGVVVVVAPLVRLLVQHHAPTWMLQNELLYRLTPFQLDSLLLGGLVALLWRGKEQQTLVLAARIFAIGATLVSAIYITFVLLHLGGAHWRFEYPYPTWKFTWGLTFVNFFAASLIVSVLRPQGVLYQVLRLPALRWIGRISYGAYVLHDIPHLWYRAAYEQALSFLAAHTGPHLRILTTPHDITFLSTAMACTLLLAWFSFRFFETPFLNLKEKFAASTPRR